MATEQLKYSLKYFKKMIGELARENKNPNNKSGILPKLYQEVITLKTSGSMSVLPCRILKEACEILASQIHNQLNEKMPSITSNVASLTILNILTSSSIDKQVYLEDVIDKVITYLHQQLFVCCRDSTDNEEENTNNNKKIESMHLAINLLTELVFVHSLVDVHVTKISCIGVYAFGNGCHSLKISSIRLLCGVFSKYESHQFTILNDIQEYSVKCGSPDKLTSSFPINNSSKNISAFCVLVMSLLQNTTVLPKELCGSSLKSSEEVDCLNMKNLESFILKKHKNIMVYSHHVTNEFLKGYIKQNGHHSKYYEAAFADFIHDLLSVLEEPDWPASIILLSAIAKHLANILHSASASPTVLTVCMRWLCEIMVKVNKTAQLSEKNNEKLDEIISKTQYKLMKCNSYPTDCAKENSRYQHLQSIFLNYVVGKSQTYHTVVSLDNFYIIIWCSQLISQESVISKNLNKKGKYILTENKENEPSAGHARKSKNKNQKKQMLLIAETSALLVKSLLQFDDMSIVLCPLDVKMIISYFINKAEIITYFNVYLTHIINMLTFKQPVVRAKTMQCLKLFMDADMAFAEKPLIQYVMRTFLKDNCITVREISVDLIGRCMLHLPEKYEQFYPLLIPHLLDRGINVRKQAFKILKDLTTRHPNFSKLPEVQSKLLERIEDPAMKHMVLEMFRDKWFTPLNKTDKMIDQIKQLNEVMKISGISGVHCLKVLLEELLGTKGTVKNCKQFVECFVNYLLDHEANNSTEDLCVCLQVLNIVAETVPDILVDYIPVLQSYLSLHQQENENIIISVVGILQHTVVLYQNPPEIFLTKLEEDLLKLILVHKHSVVERCVPCLTLLVKDITENHKLIFDCFSLFFGALKKFAEDKFSFSDQSISPESYIQRCLLITGLFLKHYDFSSSNAQEFFEEEIIDNVFNTFIQILRKSNSSIQWYTLIALGEMCYHHSDYLLRNNLKVIYKNILTSKNVEERMKCQVLKNLEYILEKESQMTEKDKKWTSPENVVSSTKQTLRLQNEDENSNMTIIIIQQYLEQITSCCVCEDHSVRCVSASILKLVVQHGLVPPQKIMAHVIALTTDNDSIICNEACSILKQVDCTYPGVFDFTMQVGINLSYGLQSILQQSQVIRGYIGTDGPSHALLTHLYKIVQRKKFRRRHFIRIILNQFTETEEDIDKLLYLSDNLAYLPYEFEDEILFIMQTINMIGATTGFNFLENFKQQLIPNESKCKIRKEGSPSDSNDSDNENIETFEDLVNQLPKNTKNLQKCVLSFQQCRFLLKVKHYLQQTYGISNRMVVLYSSEQHRASIELNVKNHCNFMTDSDLKLLIEMKSMKDISNEELIKQYLEFKNLLLSENEVCSKNQKLSYRNFKQEKSWELNKTKGSGRKCNRRRIKNSLKDVDSDASDSE
ncbi:Nipped-B protein [Gryllus bimaculatus]|nr:Nipped-B protein [Gryllus bimaculatus]